MSTSVERVRKHRVLHADTDFEARILAMFPAGAVPDFDGDNCLWAAGFGLPGSKAVLADRLLKSKIPDFAPDHDHIAHFRTHGMTRAEAVAFARQENVVRFLENPGWHARKVVEPNPPKNESPAEWNNFLAHETVGLSVKAGTLKGEFTTDEANLELARAQQLFVDEYGGRRVTPEGAGPDTEIESTPDFSDLLAFEQQKAERPKHCPHGSLWDNCTVCRSDPRTTRVSLIMKCRICGDLKRATLDVPLSARGVEVLNFQCVRHGYDAHGYIRGVKGLKGTPGAGGMGVYFDVNK